MRQVRQLRKVQVGMRWLISRPTVKSGSPKGTLFGTTLYLRTAASDALLSPLRGLEYFLD